MQKNVENNIMNTDVPVTQFCQILRHGRIFIGFILFVCFNEKWNITLKS